MITVHNNLEGLKKSVNDGSTSAFLWEWYVYGFRSQALLDLSTLGLPPSPL